MFSGVVLKLLSLVGFVSSIVCKSSFVLPLILIGISGCFLLMILNFGENKGEQGKENKLWLLRFICRSAVLKILSVLHARSLKK